MLATVISTVEEQQVDVVLIAGDVYDRALPPEWAVEALENCLLELVKRGAQVVITSGNHDSAARLGFGRGLMAASGVHIRSSLEDAWTPVDLQVGSERLRIFGVPYLEPQLYAAALGCQRASHTEVMRQVVEKIRSADDDDSVPTIMMAHLFAAHGVATESERSIGVQVPAGQSPEHHEETLGGLAVVPLELFEGFGYVALGHLHGRQRLSDTVRYSGSPVVYSFSEAEQAKGAWMLTSEAVEAQSDDFQGSQLGQGWEVTALDWRIGRSAVRLKGTLEQLMDPVTVESARESFVQVKLTDEQRPPRAYQLLREVYPHLASFSYEGTGASATSTYSARVRAAVDDHQLISGFLDHVRNRPASESEQHAIATALEEVRVP